MEYIRKKPVALLALFALVVASFAVSRLTSGARGPACVELPAAQPGFAALSTATTPACIRIRLH